jgi:hypothetical protein
MSPRNGFSILSGWATARNRLHVCNPHDVSEKLLLRLYERGSFFNMV